MVLLPPGPQQAGRVRGQVTCSGLGTSLPGSGSLERCLCWKAAPPPLSRPHRRPHCLGLGLVGLLIPPIHTPTPTLAHLPALREKALEEGLETREGHRPCLRESWAPGTTLWAHRGNIRYSLCAGVPARHGPRAIGQSGTAPWMVRVSGAKCYREPRNQTSAGFVPPGGRQTRRPRSRGHSGVSGSSL